MANAVDAATNRRAYTVAEIAEQLGCPPGTVYGWIADGLLPHWKIGRRVFIPVDAWEAWLAARVQGGTDPAPPAPAPPVNPVPFPVPRSHRARRL